MTSFGMSGVFPNRIDDTDMIVDPFLDKPSDKTQEELRSEVQDFEEIMALDYKYCTMVEGVSQESNLWVPRNQNETGLVDTDLQKFKNVTWNECVVRKFLTSEKGDVNTVGQSMINIIQALNLQWKNLQVMGVHPKIEAAEKQVIMRCFEDNLFDFTLQIGVVARAFRRCEHFSDFYANAVGGYVCHNTGRTPGLSKTQYGSDIDFSYREKNYFFFVNALRKRKDIVQKCIMHSDNVDYVSRLTQLKILKPMGPNVDLQDYDIGKPQQPMYVTSQGSNTGIDIGDIIKLLDNKITKMLERGEETPLPRRRPILEPEDMRGDYASLLRNAETVYQQITSSLHQFNDLDLQAVIQFETMARAEIFQIMEHLNQMIQHLAAGNVTGIPPPPAPAPLPRAVDNFIRRVRPALSVGNEAVLNDTPFTRLPRVASTLDPLSYSVAQIDQNLNQFT